MIHIARELQNARKNSITSSPIDLFAILLSDMWSRCRPRSTESRRLCISSISFIFLLKNAIEMDSQKMRVRLKIKFARPFRSAGTTPSIHIVT